MKRAVQIKTVETNILLFTWVLETLSSKILNLCGHLMWFGRLPCAYCSLLLTNNPHFRGETPVQPTISSDDSIASLLTYETCFATLHPLHFLDTSYPIFPIYTWLFDKIMMFLLCTVYYLENMVLPIRVEIFMLLWQVSINNTSIMTPVSVRLVPPIHTEHMESWAVMPRNATTWGEAEGARVIARMC